MEDELKNINWDIVAVGEVKRCGEGLQTSIGGIVLFI